MSSKNTSPPLDELQDAAEVIVDRILNRSRDVARIPIGFFHVRRDDEQGYSKPLNILLPVGATAGQETHRAYPAEF